MDSSRKHTILLLGIVAFSAILNLWNNQFGLPYVFGRNVEGRIVSITVNAFASGDLNPHTAIYPHLQLYILMAAFLPFYIWGKWTGLVTSRADFLTIFQTDPTPFYAISRSVTAIFGSGCVVMIYLISRRLFGKTTGLIAALFAAGAPLLVSNSHLVTPDVMMTFFILASFYFAIRIREGGTGFDYFTSGAMLGLGFAAKYPAAIAAAFILCAHLLRKDNGDESSESEPEWGLLPLLFSITTGIMIILIAMFFDLTPVISPIRRNFGVEARSILLAIRTIAILLGSILIFLPYLCRKIGFLGRALYRHRLFILSMIGCLFFIFIGSPYLFIDISVTMNSILYHALTESEPFWGTEETPVGWYYYLVLLKDGTSLVFVPFFLAGIALLLFRRRRNDLLLLTFPLIYYAFMGSFETKFPRYILPMVPFIAIFAASTLDTLTGTDGSRDRSRWRAAWIVLLVVIAIPSLVASIRWDLKMGRTDTRTTAKEWIEETIPDGSRVAIEALGPPLDGTRYELYSYFQGEIREISGIDPWFHFRLGEAGKVQSLIDAGIEYVVVNSNTFSNYYRVPHLHPDGYEFYTGLDDQLTRLKTFPPGDGPGPEIRVYSVEAEPDSKE